MKKIKVLFIIGILSGSSFAYCQESTAPQFYNDEMIHDDSYELPQEETERSLYPDEVEQEEWDRGEPLPDDTQYFNPSEDYDSF